MIGVANYQMARYVAGPSKHFYRSSHVRGEKGIFLAHAEIDLALDTQGEQMGEPVRSTIERCRGSLLLPRRYRLRGRYFHHVPPRGTPYRIAIAVQFGLNVKKIV